MTATTHEASASYLDATRGGGVLLGFGTFFRKELTDWLRSRRAVIVFLVTVLLSSLGTAAARIEAAVAPAVGESIEGLSLDPTANVIASQIDQWLVIVGIFATMGLLVGEREKGTMAWSLSKPLSRTAMLLAKWSAGTLVYVVAGLVLPMIVVVALATVVYGGLPDLRVVGMVTGGLIALPAFYLALTLALGSRLSSQAGVAGIAVGISAVPLVAGNFAPTIASAWPSWIGSWVIGAASGAPVPWTTPVAWLVGLAGAAAFAYVTFRRTEL